MFSMYAASRPAKVRVNFCVEPRLGTHVTFSKGSMATTATLPLVYTNQLVILSSSPLLHCGASALSEPTAGILEDSDRSCHHNALVTFRVLRDVIGSPALSQSARPNSPREEVLGHIIPGRPLRLPHAAGRRAADHAAAGPPRKSEQPQQSVDPHRQSGHWRLPVGAAGSSLWVE